MKPPFFAFFIKHKFFSIFILIWIISGWYYFIANNSDDINLWYETFAQNRELTVSTGSLENSIFVVWDASLEDEQSLSFNKAGSITNVFFDIWDNVSRWDIIAQIDDQDAYDAIETARISLTNANLDYQELYEDKDESALISAKNSIVQSENTYKIAQKELENLKISQNNKIEQSLQNIQNLQTDISSDEVNLEIAEKNLEIFIKQNSQSLNNSQSSKSTTILNIENDFLSYLWDIKIIIDQADQILWITDKNKDLNDDYDQYLSAKNTGLKYEAKQSLRENLQELETLKVLINNYDYSWEKEKISEILTNILDIYSHSYETLDSLYEAVDSSIVSVGSLSQSEINSMKSSTLSNRNNTLNKISQIRSQINTLENLTDLDLLSDSQQTELLSKQESINNQKFSLEKAKQSLEIAKNDFNEMLANQKVELENKQNNLDDKKKSYDLAIIKQEELLEWPTQKNILRATNSIKQAEIKLQSAYDSLEDYQIIAPFDGIITNNDYQVWDKITNDTNKSIYIENQDQLQLTVTIDQVDIVNVEELDSAIVTFDAYPDLEVAAEVSRIDTTPVVNSWVVSYEVYIRLTDENFDKKILSWMTADIEIFTEKLDNIIAIDSSYISQDTNSNSVVNVKNNDKIQKTIVEVWATVDGKSQIISGLEVWDVIVSEQSRKRQVSWNDESTTLFGPTGWWNRPEWNFQAGGRQR